MFQSNCCCGSLKSSYPSGNLIGERLHQVADAVLSHDRSVEDKLLVAVICLLNVETIRHQRVPVIKGVELRCNAVLVLEALVKEQLRIKLQFEVIATEMLHVVLNHDFDGLTCQMRNVTVYTMKTL